MNNPRILIIGGNSPFGQIFHKLFRKHKAKVKSIGRREKKKQNELVASFDIVIISVPISETEKVIREIRPFIRKDALLADFTSLKERSVKEMKKAKSGVLGMHPLFGPLVTNLKDQNVVFCPVRNNKWSLWIEKAFKKEKMKIIKMTPRKHDEVMARNQTFTHLLNFLFAEVVSKKYRMNELQKLETPIFKIQSILAGRIISGKPSLYAEIQTYNPHFKKILKEMTKILSEYEKSIQKGETKAIERKIVSLKKRLRGFVEKARKESKRVI